jgi:AcrR family transcriptional regulator
MTDRRPYRSALRERHAGMTRAAILDAAQRLFLDGGYGRTTIGAIAATADVAPATVYAAFGDKPSLLWFIAERALGATSPAGGLSIVEALGAEPDRARRLDLGARWTREMHERGVGDYERIVEMAALVEPRLEKLLREMQERRHAFAMQLTSAIMEGFALRPGTTLQELATACEALGSVAIYEQLTRLRGWSPSQYEDWFRSLLERTLFGCPGPEMRPPQAVE